ncbi:MAG: nuclear transport factor 2 family protein [Actinomycetota bacterium]
MSSPTTTEETRRIIEEYYAAASSGNLPAAMSYVHRDVEVHEGPNLPFGKTYRGHDGFTEILVALSPYVDLSGMTIRNVIAEGNQAVALLVVPVQGQDGDVEVAEHWTLQDGLIRNGQIYVFDPSGIQTPR